MIGWRRLRRSARGGTRSDQNYQYSKPNLYVHADRKMIYDKRRHPGYTDTRCNNYKRRHVDSGDQNTHDFGIRVGFVYLCVLRYFKVAKSHLI